MQRTVSLLDRGLPGSLLAQDKEGFSGKVGFRTRYLRFGSFEVDLQCQELSRDGSRVKVQGKAYQTLIALLENPGGIVTRESLVIYLWPMEKAIDYHANLNTTVNKLRRVLRNTGDESVFIETIPRRGYSFIAKVEYVDQPRVAMAARRSGEAAVEKTSFLFWPSSMEFLGRDRSSICFKAGVVALVIGSMLFGAAIMLYAHRPS